MLDVLNERAQQPFINMKFRILYLENNQVVHEVEVRNVSYVDLKRHLHAGETVEIIPEFAGHEVGHNHHDEIPYYITHF
jgi:molybdopterin converting factor small subunit